MPTTLMDAPASTPSQAIEVMGAIDAYDAVLRDDYAFVMFKETDRDSAAWRVRIKGRHMTGVVFEPEQMRFQARAADAQCKTFFTWGSGIDPSAGDARMIQYRVHVAEAKPAAIEIVLQTRLANGTAGPAKSLKQAWPS